MSEDSYHGGHSLADLIHELLRRPFFSLREVQEVLAQMLLDREIVLSEELPRGWYLEWASVREEGDGWVRLGGRRVMLVINGKRRDPREFRYHEPPPPVRPKQIVEPEPPQPDADPPSIATEEPASDAALPPLGRAGHAGHSFADILERWHRYPYSLPQVQEYAAHLLASGEMVLSEELPEGWSLVSAREVLRSYGVRDRSIIIVTSDGRGCDPAEIRCHFPNDPLLAGPLQLSRLRKPAAPVESSKAPLSEPMTAAPGTAVGKEPLEAEPAKPMTLRKAAIKAALDMVLEAAKWLAPQISKDSKVDDYEGDCLKEFPGLSPSTYRKRVVPAARVLRGWPAQTPPGQKPKPKPK